MTYLSSPQKRTPKIWMHLETATRLPLPKGTRHITIPIGMSYGKLSITSTPFKLEGYEKYTYYECSCECGNSKVVRSQRLGKTVSCGCRMRESSRENGGQNKRKGSVLCVNCGTEFEYLGTTCYRCRHQKHRENANRRSKGWSARQEVSPYRYLNLMLVQARARENRKKKTGHLSRCVEIDKKFICTLWDEQNGKCAITGIQMTHRKRDPRAVSIDRIDSDKGYTGDNVQLICVFANLGKRDFNNEEIKLLIKDVRSVSTY